MKLHTSAPAATGRTHAFTAYGDGYVDVDGVRWTQPIVVAPDRAVAPWPATRFEELAPEHFAAAAALDPELVLFGSGQRLRFPHPRLLAPLTARGVGVETMDVQAACRTFNILAQEGRRVVALLLVEGGA